MAPPKIDFPPPKEKYSGLATASIGTKGRRTVTSAVHNGSSSRDAVGSGVGAETSNGQLSTAEGVDGINWSSFDRATLHSYRHAYRLNTPAAFTCAYNQSVLAGSSIGRCSPTMARPKEKRRVSKDHLALAVRKDFNAAGVSEQEVITTFLYSVHNQNKYFRLRFSPSRTK